MSAKHTLKLVALVAAAALNLALAAGLDALATQHQAPAVLQAAAAKTPGG